MEQRLCDCETDWLFQLAYGVNNRWGVEMVRAKSRRLCRPIIIPYTDDVAMP